MKYAVLAAAMLAAFPCLAQTPAKPPGAVAVPAAAQTRPPAEAFGNLPVASGMSLSHDGKYMAAIQSAFGRPIGVIYDITTGAAPVPLSTGDWILEDLRWAPDDRLIMTVKQNTKSPYGSEMVTWTHAISVDPTGKNPNTLMSNLPTYQYNQNTAFVLDLNGDAPDRILMELYNIEYAPAAVGSRLDDNTDKARLDVVSVDVKTGRGEILDHGEIRPDRVTIRWISDGGHIIGRIDQTYMPLREHLMLKTDGKWNEVDVFDAEGDKSSGIMGLTEDGKALVRMVTDSRSMQVLERYDLATQKASLLFAAPSSDVDDVIEDPWTGRIIGAVYIDDKPQRRYFNPPDRPPSSASIMCFRASPWPSSPKARPVTGFCLPSMVPNRRLPITS